MNTKLLLLALSLAAFSSCTTLYKAGQTPDDVYFSPVRTYPAGEEKREVQRDVQRDEVNNYNSYNSDYRSVRLGINDRRFRNFDYDFGFSPYNYLYNPYNYGFNSYNNYGMNLGYNHGYYYNPYFWPYPVYSVYNPIYLNPSTPKITTPRMANLGGYNPVYNNVPKHPGATNTNTRQSRSYNNRNEGSAVGNVIRQVFSPANPGNNNNNNSNSSNRVNSNNNTPSSNNTRSYTPSSSSSSSSSGSSSSGGGVTRQPRSGGN